MRATCNATPSFSPTMIRRPTAKAFRRTKQRCQGPRLLDQSPRLRLGIAELYHAHPAGNRLAHRVQHAAGTAQRVIGDEID